MKLKIDKEDAEGLRVDRDSTLNSYGTQGFYIDLAGLRLHFEDERDAVRLAKEILQRMGEWPCPIR